MLKQDDSDREDPLGVSKGIVYGVVIGALLWAVIIGCLILVFR